MLFPIMHLEEKGPQTLAQGDVRIAVGSFSSTEGQSFRPSLFPILTSTDFARCRLVMAKSPLASCVHLVEGGGAVVCVHRGVRLL